jgi:hypothetical protein
MSDVEKPDDWTEEEWTDYFETSYDTADENVQVAGAFEVEVPDIQATEGSS